MKFEIEDEVYAQLIEWLDSVKDIVVSAAIATITVLLILEGFGYI